MVDIPVVAIAKRDSTEVPELLATGVHGVAVVGAVAGADDPEAATSGLVALLRESA